MIQISYDIESLIKTVDFFCLTIIYIIEVER